MGCKTSEVSETSEVWERRRLVRPAQVQEDLPIGKLVF